MPQYGTHSYLNENISEKNCRKILEIGVYDGENAINMVETAAKNIPPQEVEYYRFDFFSYYSSDIVRRKLEKQDEHTRIKYLDIPLHLMQYIKSS